MIHKNVPKRRGCYVTESVTYTPNGKSTNVLRRQKNYANGCVSVYGSWLKLDLLVTDFVT